LNVSVAVLSSLNAIPKPILTLSQVGAQQVSSICLILSTALHNASHRLLTDSAKFAGLTINAGLPMSCGNWTGLHLENRYSPDVPSVSHDCLFIETKPVDQGVWAFRFRLLFHQGYP